MKKSEWKKFEDIYKLMHWDLQKYASTIEADFRNNPSLVTGGQNAVHSTKMRIKDSSSLKAKILRKRDEGCEITPEDFTSKITDLAGVRILMLFKSDYTAIDALIRSKVQASDWVLAEQGKAIFWDPEDQSFFAHFDLDVQNRETAYTSVHFLIKPNASSNLCCELQIRTLFEEIWGEVDHRLNYPVKSKSVACREQLRVLSKISGAGSRLLDSIQHTVSDRK
jgi:putative GTP pyrophosphokinase